MNALASAPPTLTPRTRLRPEPWQGAPKPPRLWQGEALPAILAAIGRYRPPSAPVRPLVHAVMGAGKSVLISEIAHRALNARAYEEDIILIAAPRQNLVKQLSDTVRQRCGRESVGVYYQHGKQPRRPIIVCCYDSLPGLIDELVTLGRRCALFIGDEAHRTECATVLDAWTRLQPLAAIGVTATPYRADPDQPLSLWTEVVYEYGMDRAWAEGVLVDYRHIRVPAAWVESGEVPASGEGEEGVRALDAACLRLIREAEIQGLHTFPLISSAMDIADAESFAAVCREAGYTVGTVHSQRSTADNEAAVRKLERGDVQIVVQVSMLSEGSDFPWLRGLLLRRNIGSPVMAFQFMGRVLRSHPGKEYAVILDPHRNLDRHGVSHPAMLGAAMVAAAEAEARGNGQGQEEPDPKTIEIAYVGDVEAWTSAALLAMDAAKMRPSKAERFATSTEWRTGTATERQVDTLIRMRWATKLLPTEAREPVRQLVDHAPDLPRGAVADLLDLLFAVSWASKATRDAAKARAEATGSWVGAPQWRWPDTVKLPPVPPVPKPMRTRRKEALDATA